jgi:hypothetical protein
LIEELEALVSDSIAITTNDPAATSIDEKALLAKLASAWQGVMDAAGEIIPVLERLDAKLSAALAMAPRELENKNMSYIVATLKMQHPDLPQISMPREIAAFVVCDRIRRAKQSCHYVLVKGRYESLRRSDDRCDCQARAQSSFFFGRPEGPLELMDSAGVPYAAMDYLWQCRACGTKWFEDEGHDDMGSHSTWRLAPSDAMNA